MSHFVFGEYVEKYSKYKVCHHYGNNKNILYYFDDEINFYDNLFKMINENTTLDKKKVFCIVSRLQEKNSEDILFPYDKFTNEELFPSTDDRGHFEELCINNLKESFESIKSFINEISPVSLRIYVTDGYDDEFSILQCDLKEMFEDLKEQVINSFSLDSKIYEIRI